MTNKFNGKQFVEELAPSAKVYLVAHVYRQIKDDCPSEEISTVLEDLHNERLDNLEELVSAPLMDYLTQVKEEQPLFDRLYLVEDVQEDEASWCGTFEQVQEYVLDFWAIDVDDDMTEIEHNELLDDIKATQKPDELNMFLSGIGYYMEVMN